MARMSCTKDCWEDVALAYFSAVQGEIAIRRKQELSRFARVNLDTVRRWCSGDLPYAERLLALRFFLDLIGCSVQELAEMPAELRLLAEGLVYGLTNIQACADAIGMQPKKLLDSVMGRRSLSPARTEKLRQILRDFHMEEGVEELRRKERERLEDIFPVSASSVLGQRSDKDHAPLSNVSDTPANSPLFLEALHHQLEATLNMVEVFERTSTEESRKKLRQMFRNGKGMFLLSNITTRLCSERTREEVARRQQPVAFQANSNEAGERKKS